MRRATMRDVARHAGVSLKTVSRVVNAESGVSDELVGKVRAAAESLDYRHNLAARNLRLSQPGTTSFAVLVQDLSNGYSAELLRAVDDVARQRQSVMIAASLDEEADRERDLVANLINRRVDGLILMPASQDLSYLAADMAAGFKVVVIDRATAGLDTDSVLVDNVTGAALGTGHLLAQGHRRVAVVTDDQRIVTAQERLLGYRQALAGAGMPYDPTLVGSARTAVDAAEQVTKLLSHPDPPTAIFAARNDVTLGAVLVPALTVVAQDPAEVGRRAARLLLDRLAGSTAEPQHLVLQTRLITRGSGEIRPVEP